MRAAQLERDLRQRFGELLTPNDLAGVLGYPSGEAVRKAHSRGRLPIELSRHPPRRGWYTTPAVVAKYLSKVREGKLSEQEDV